MIPEHLTPACHRMHITVRQPHMAAKQQKMQGTGRKSYGNISEIFTARKKGKWESKVDNCLWRKRTLMNVGSDANSFLNRNIFR